MFVICDLQDYAIKKYVVTFIIYVRTKFHTANYNNSAIIRNFSHAVRFIILHSTEILHERELHIFIPGYRNKCSFRARHVVIIDCTKI